MPPLRRATRADVLATLAVVASVTAAAAAHPALRALAERPSRAACLSLLERYVELTARAVDPDPVRAAAAIEERKAAALAAAERGFPRCEAELTREEVDCGLRAGSADELERCLP